MKLNQINPQPISSVLVRNWKADAPTWIVLVAIVLPTLILDWPHKWLFFGLAAIAAYAAETGMSKLRQHLRIKDALTPPLAFPDPPDIDIVGRSNRWKALLDNGPVKSFVLFSYGTCVVSVDEVSDPAENATALLQQFGHAVPGTPSGDMLVYELPDTGDFVIGGHHPNILTFVARDMISENVPVDQRDTAAAFRGRDLRALDTFALQPIHTDIVDHVA